MQDNKCGEKLAAALKGRKIDILINNAGYFYEPVEKVDSLNFDEVRHCMENVLLYTEFCVLRLFLHFIVLHST